ncbi:MAG: hypothetical protein ABIK32_04640 [Chloroflexota bacterium]
MDKHILLYDHKRDGPLKVGETLLVYEDGHTEKEKAETLREPKPVPPARDTSWGQIIQYDNGQAWGIASDLRTVYLGLEADVRAAIDNPELKCGEPIIDGIIDKERELKRSEGYEARNAAVRTLSSRKLRTIKSHNKRIRFTTAAKHKPFNTRQLKAR